jgi:hypothetical protein
MFGEFEMEIRSLQEVFKGVIRCRAAALRKIFHFKVAFLCEDEG